MYQSRIRNYAGMSLVEVIVGVIIIGLTFSAYAGMMAKMQLEGEKNDIRARGVMLAQSYLERALSKRFDENYTPNWSSTVGPEESDESNFDDVDDYAGYTDNSIDGYDYFTLKMRVFYVDPSTSWEDSVAGPTNYKRILARVIHAELDSLEISVMVSSRYNVN